MARLFGLIVLTLSSVAGVPSTMQVTATAYCQHGTTQSGTRARTGIVAADPTILPVGTVLRLLDSQYSGIYTVMDTGSAIKGRRIDIFVPDCSAAEQFGERRVHVRIIRHGWNPKATPTKSDSQAGRSRTLLY
ncbi:MAG TPA: 3D domain-containing protein [Vicinamibacterales bacterium]|jgi:3D (Asp-Asp-Asp) domain-containing protein